MESRPHSWQRCEHGDDALDGYRHDRLSIHARQHFNHTGNVSGIPHKYGAYLPRVFRAHYSWGSHLP